MATAAILTIGNELVSGDVPNSNGTWLARRLEPLGVRVTLLSAIPDEIDRIAAWVRAEAQLVDHVLVTGGLGGTPDDVTREAIAAAYGVGQTVVEELAAELRGRFQRHPEYVTRWANLPVGSTPLVNPLGGAPGFRIANTIVLPGLPAEMEAMFDLVASGLAAALPIVSWRRRFPTTEARIVDVLEMLELLHPDVLLGSYPSFDPAGPEVELVLKATDAGALAAAVAWLEPALEPRLA